MATKFGDFGYTRPDLEAFESGMRTLIGEFAGAPDPETQKETYITIIRKMEHVNTMRTLARIRFTVNTNDEYYNAEHEFFDNNKPKFLEIESELKKALLGSKFRKELEKDLGKIVFDHAETDLRTFSKEIADELVKESKLTNEYIKLIASAKIPFRGEDRNIAGMEPFMQSSDRSERKEANEAKWKFFEDNEKEFDRIYDELVKVRTAMARKLGYDNFIQLGYDRMHRFDYGPEQVKQFRDNVKEFIVPASEVLHEMRRKRLGLEKLYYYDALYDFADGNPFPKGDPKWIVDNAVSMYEELSPETSEFINFMVDGDLMDLYNRNGKSNGGYCSFLGDFKSPFIFANMNGTSHDVRVLTHEAGHAFQAFVCRNEVNPAFRHATAEACEVHSMGMEFLTWPWMKLFFGEDGDKFLFHHLTRALKFIPYGVSIDEFQHFVYENPEASPAERKAQWREIEKKYTPMVDYADNDFLKRGGFWFHQQHVFRMPFYYIDYCLAQVCALQIWKKSNKDRSKAWEDYLRLCRAGGRKPFLELLKIADIQSPFEGKTIEDIVSYARGWAEDNESVMAVGAV